MLRFAGENGVSVAVNAVDDEGSGWSVVAQACMPDIKTPGLAALQTLADGVG